MTKLGYAICGSFCTISNSLEQLKKLAADGYDIYPIFSPIVYSTDTRFTKASELRETVETITGKKVMSTITETEPIGPKKMFDALVISPCTSNTMAKLANGINDTPVTMAVKSHVRNNRPVIIAPATNDALGVTAKNIGVLLNTRNYYFVPFAQDEPFEKERSMIADFSLLEETILAALSNQQLRPIIK